MSGRRAAISSTRAESWTAISMHTSPKAKTPNEDAAFLASRLDALREFAEAVDEGVEAFAEGRPFTSEPLQRIRVIGGGE